LVDRIRNFKSNASQFKERITKKCATGQFFDEKKCDAHFFSVHFLKRKCGVL
jgi:hypothetical protein